MIIMVSTLAKAINEVRYIKPEEIINDTIKNLDKESSSKPETKNDNKA